ncbi:MAG TPA: hypothetical protein VK631_23610 [Solirubrobacteraceae bacterium]|nr:hypothetical protein [Solirubrobacteraceae bacterium]
MHPSARRLDLRTLRAAAVTESGAVVPLPFLTAGTLVWPWEHVHRVLHEWRLWIGGAGGVVTSSARVLRTPRRAPVVAIDVAIAGESDAAADRLAALRRLEPAADTVRIGPPTTLRPAIERVPAGMAPITAHLRLRELPALAIDAFTAAAGPDSRSELLAAELHHLGGAYALAAVGAARDAEEAVRVRIGLDDLVRRLAPWA